MTIAKNRKKKERERKIEKERERSKEKRRSKMGNRSLWGQIPKQGNRINTSSTKIKVTFLSN